VAEHFVVDARLTQGVVINRRVDGDNGLFQSTLGLGCNGAEVQVGAGRPVRRQHSDPLCLEGKLLKDVPPGAKMPKKFVNYSLEHLSGDV